MIRGSSFLVPQASRKWSCCHAISYVYWLTTLVI